jgi:serine/threonine protein kinase
LNLIQTPQIPKMYSDSLIGIVTSMLRKEPDDRPTAKEILQDPYMKQHIERFLEKTQAK